MEIPSIKANIPVQNPSPELIKRSRPNVKFRAN